MNSYSEFLSYLNKLDKLGIKFGLDNINRILERLGSPQEKLHFIHIAGTNGKGSVAAMLSSILTKAGLKTGLYTSPHLIDVKERIRINEIDITEQELLEEAKKIIPLAPENTTYFELLTAIAIDFFYEKRIDISILETGMGGRLDATNACTGEIAIITDISLEHTQYLGNTIEEIAKEKTAIIKPGTTAVTADSLDSDFTVYSRNLEYQKIRINGYDNLKLNLLGDHQVRNCALALKAVNVLRNRGYNIPAKSIYEGLENTRWPGRFQIISKPPHPYWCGGKEPLIILDGAHNPGAALVLRDTVEKYIGNKVTLVIGILKDKDYRGILDILNPIAERIITVTPKNERALSGRVLKEYVSPALSAAEQDNYARKGGVKSEYFEDVRDALEDASGGPRILVTGSLYLIGEVLNMFEAQPRTCTISGHENDNL